MEVLPDEDKVSIASFSKEHWEALLQCHADLQVRLSTALKLSHVSASLERKAAALCFISFQNDGNQRNSAPCITFLTAIQCGASQAGPLERKAARRHTEVLEERRTSFFTVHQSTDLHVTPYL